MPQLSGHKAVLLFDGGSRGNPGPAYGSYQLWSPGAAKPQLLRLTFGRLTNNEAEYATLIAGLEDLEQRLRQARLMPGDVHLEIRGDSQLVLSQLSGEWRVRNERMRAYWERATQLVGSYAALRCVRVPRWRVVKELGH
jgi:ribonuclease HI